jgi:hypothetical protein
MERVFFAHNTYLPQLHLNDMHERASLYDSTRWEVRFWYSGGDPRRRHNDEARKTRFTGATRSAQHWQ